MKGSLPSVLVVNAGTHEGRPPLETPCGAIIIAELLASHRFPVSFVDLTGRRLTDRYAAELFAQRPDIVMFSLMGGDFVERSLWLARWARDRLPAALLVAGGSFCTFHVTRHKDVLPLAPFDVIVAGDGELAALDVTREHSSFPRGQGAVVVDGRPVLLDSLPLLGETVDLSRYVTDLDGYMPGYRTTQINTSRFCPFRCTFCHRNWDPQVPGAPMMSAERIIEQTRLLRDRFGVRGLYFTDDLLSVSPRRLHALAEAWARASRRSSPFFGDFRSTDFSRRRVDLDLLVNGGLCHVYIGMESGSDRILELMRKDATIADHIEAVERLRAKGVLVTGSFVFGHSEERQEDAEATMALLERLDLDFYEIHALAEPVMPVRTRVTTPEQADAFLISLARSANWGDARPANAEQERYLPAYFRRAQRRFGRARRRWRTWRNLPVAVSAWLRDEGRR